MGNHQPKPPPKVTKVAIVPTASPLIFPIGFLGDMGVGKTSIVEQLARNTGQQVSAEGKMDYNIMIAGNMVTLKLHDCVAVVDRFNMHRAIQQYMRAGRFAGYFIVSSRDIPESLGNRRRWACEMERYANIYDYEFDNETPSCIFVENKIELINLPPTYDDENGEENRIRVSAHANISIHEMMEKMAYCLYYRSDYGAYFDKFEKSVKDAIRNNEVGKMMKMEVRRMMWAFGNYGEYFPRCLTLLCQIIGMDREKFEEVDGMVEIAFECNSLEMLTQYMKNIDIRLIPLDFDADRVAELNANKGKHQFTDGLADFKTRRASVVRKKLPLHPALKSGTTPSSSPTSPKLKSSSPNDESPNTTVTLTQEKNAKDDDSPTQETSTNASSTTAKCTTDDLESAENFETVQTDSVTFQAASLESKIYRRLEGKAQWAVSIYGYVHTEENDKHFLRFEQGQYFEVLYDGGDLSGWWIVVNDQMKKGFVPGNYLQYITFEQMVDQIAKKLPAFQQKQVVLKPMCIIGRRKYGDAKDVKPKPRAKFPLYQLIDGSEAQIQNEIKFSKACARISQKFGMAQCDELVYTLQGERVYFYSCWIRLRLFLAACNISQLEYDWTKKKMSKKLIEFWLPYEVQMQIIAKFTNYYLYFRSLVVVNSII